MKQILILAVICLSLCNGLQKEKERGKQLAMVLLKDCKNKEGGTDQDIATLAGEEIPATTSGQCMLACVYEKLDVVSFTIFIIFQLQLNCLFFNQYKDGVFQRENFLELAKVLTENHEKKMKYVEQFANDCGGIEGDRCSQSAKFTKCVHDGITSIMHEDFDIV